MAIGLWALKKKFILPQVCLLIMHTYVIHYCKGPQNTILLYRIQYIY